MRLIDPGSKRSLIRILTQRNSSYRLVVLFRDTLRLGLYGRK